MLHVAGGMSSGKVDLSSHSFCYKLYVLGVRARLVRLAVVRTRALLGLLTQSITCCGAVLVACFTCRRMVRAPAAGSSDATWTC